MNESNREKFVRLAERRVTNAIKAIQLVGNLSNKSNYSYDQADVEKIFSVLNKELKMCQNKFRNSAQNKTQIFTLEE